MSGRKLYLSCMNSYSVNVVTAHFYFVMNIFFVWILTSEQNRGAEAKLGNTVFLFFFFQKSLYVIIGYNSYILVCF